METKPEEHPKFEEVLEKLRANAQNLINDVEKLTTLIQKPSDTPSGIPTREQIVSMIRTLNAEGMPAMACEIRNLLGHNVEHILYRMQKAGLLVCTSPKGTDRGSRIYSLPGSVAESKAEVSAAVAAAFCGGLINNVNNEESK